MERLLTISKIGSSSSTDGQIHSRWSVGSGIVHSITMNEVLAQAVALTDLENVMLSGGSQTGKRAHVAGVKCIHATFPEQGTPKRWDSGRGCHGLVSGEERAHCWVWNSF